MRADPGLGLDLHVLGAGPAYADRVGAVGAAYLVRSGADAILLDLGHGAFARLAATIDPTALQAILISHPHPDHFIDLVPLRHYLRYQVHPPQRVRVIGPSGLRDALDLLHGQPGFCSEALDLELLQGGEMEIGPFRIEVVAVPHSADSHAVRVSVDDGAGLVYSGDCAGTDELAGLVRRGDTLLVEVSFGTGPVPKGAMHLDASMVRDLVDRAKPARVLLTHHLMGWDRSATVAAVQDGYDGLVELVVPGSRVHIPPRES